MPELIPSEYVRNYAEELGWEFSDLDKAALTYHLGLPFEDEIQALKDLKEDLKDENVIAQIDDFVERETTSLASLKASGDDFVFCTTYYNGLYDENTECGHFHTWEDAHARGVMLNKPFKISKYLVMSFVSADNKRIVGFRNPRFYDEEAAFEEIISKADDDGKIGTADFSESGVLLRFWNSELQPKTKDDIARHFDTSLFENAYVDLPNPFERGDIVEVITDGAGRGAYHGVIDTSQDEWEEYRKRVDNLPEVDFFDSGITIQILFEDRQIGHTHIPPTILRPYTPPDDDPDKEMLELMSTIMSGKGSLEHFLMVYEQERARYKYDNLR